MTRYRSAVGWTHVVLGSLSLLGVFILSLIFGGVWSSVAIGNGPPEATAVLGVAFGVVMVAVFSMVGLLGSLSLAAGIALLKGKPWGDALAMVASVLHLANFPIGTIVGVSSLWVLLIREPRPRALPRADATALR